jgi:SYP7 family syntaxin
MHLTKLVDKEVDKTNKIIVSQNQKLKGILVKVRAPSKFCLDIALFLFLLGLVAVIIEMIGK